MLVADIETKLIERKKQKEYFYYSEYKVNDRSIEEITKSKWPDENEQKVKFLFRNKLRIRPKIKIQSSINKIWKDSIKWEDKVIRIKDLLNAAFKEYLRSLNLTNKKDTRNF